MAEVELECAVYGEGTVFPVKIVLDAKVSALQEKIFDDQRYRERFSFPASALTLYLARKKGETTWMKHDRNTESFLQGDIDTGYGKMLSSWKLNKQELFGKNFQPEKVVEFYSIIAQKEEVIKTFYNLSFFLVAMLGRLMEFFTVPLTDKLLSAKVD
ncbi:hypothetical protein P43SY_008819 [Pythium insidiosum]|uniref:Crinkler effector protein N-terminal domain-containing protein n=1 Tax=Pythium insidiosum TaxID=114742 RepID=A0AAD5LI13_PYTIN|nr:hypothetical protein P43SY_008819 [Pythium insidiosum]